MHLWEFASDYVAFSSRLGYEEHIPGQTRDWNEELQTTRELPRKHLPERLIRERTIFKVHSDFVVAATRGAMSVIDGNIMAINPGEDTKWATLAYRTIFDKPLHPSTNPEILVKIGPLGSEVPGLEKWPLKI